MFKAYVNKQIKNIITVVNVFEKLLPPDQVLLVGHVGFAGRQRHVAVIVQGEAVLGDAVVSVGEEAWRAAAAARITTIHR